jgi:hypothetical protein
VINPAEGGDIHLAKAGDLQLAIDTQSNRLKSEEPSNREAPTGAGEVVPGLVELEVAVPRLTPAMR